MKKDKLAIISVGAKCSNKCVFCKKTYDPPTSEKELKRQEIQIYKNLIVYREKGYKSISITGSDPLEYEKLIPLIRYIKRIGFGHIMLCTHGRIQKESKLMEQLADAGVTIFRIPIYGTNAQTHESVTQVKGSFEEALNGIKSIIRLKKAKLRIVALVVQQNKGDLLKIAKFGLGFNPELFEIDVVHLYPDVKDKSFCVSYKDLWKYLKELVDYKLKMKTNNIRFNDIPYCIFGANYDFVNMPLNPFREKPKGKLEVCNNCKVSYKCDGFFMNDIKKYGMGGLKPIV